MKKGVVVVMAIVLALAVMVPAALALTDSQKAELQSLYEQQHQLRLQIIDKQAQAGLLDEADAAALRERMAERWEYRRQRMAEGDFEFGFAGRGKCGGFGRKGRSFGGGCGNCPVAGDSSAL